MYAPGAGWAPGGAATGQEWDYTRELRFSSRFLNDVTLKVNRQDKTSPFVVSPKGAKAGDFGSSRVLGRSEIRRFRPVLK